MQKTVSSTLYDKIDRYLPPDRLSLRASLGPLEFSRVQQAPDFIGSLCILLPSNPSPPVHLSTQLTCHLSRGLLDMPFLPHSHITVKLR